ncbi:hypothetical protein BCR44DRAFT_127512 [Catenaria anguillulae PL171]|uniref:Uncharacterized protein n=1 Tax=Catenaria anguillulae PL171 TaxID=765915 RepID=A0A1Y2H9Z3_9FUNG|nr:hypothetical protein BCR44DRAFT_127512 [Catenaria anguillulae PL171]
MCMPVECPLCHKTTWKGCGQHIDSVMSKLTEDQKCKCPRDQVEGELAKQSICSIL